MEVTRGLSCPACGSIRLKVQITLPGFNSTVRRRVCMACEFKFYTDETVAVDDSTYREALRAQSQDRRAYFAEKYLRRKAK